MPSRPETRRAPSPSRPRFRWPPTWKAGTTSARPSAFALGRDQARAIEQVVHGDFEDARDFAVSRSQLGTPVHDRDHRMETEAADRNVDGVSEPRIRASALGSAISSCASRSAACSNVSPGSTTPPGNEICPPWRPSVSGSNGQHDMRAIVDRKDQQQARRMANPGGIESLGPLRRGCGASTACAAAPGRGPLRRFVKTFDDIIKMHGGLHGTARRSARPS